jgi:hypothetical protein
MINTEIVINSAEKDTVKMDTCQTIGICIKRKETTIKYEKYILE